MVSDHVRGLHIARRPSRRVSQAMAPKHCSNPSSLQDICCKFEYAIHVNDVLIGSPQLPSRSCCTCDLSAALFQDCVLNISAKCTFCHCPDSWFSVSSEDDPTTTPLFQDCELLNRSTSCILQNKNRQLIGTPILCEKAVTHVNSWKLVF